MSGPVRVMIVGTGTAARVHVEALRSLDEQVQIVAGVAPDAGHAAAFCAEHRIPHAATDLAEAIDTVAPALVCVSERSTEAAVTALSEGVHAVVELPDGLALRGLDDIDAAQGPDGPFAAMVFPLRFGSGARRLRALVGDGVLGRPLVAVCHTFWFRGGDGSTMGPGVHEIDLLVSVLGEWTEISAVAHRLVHPDRTEISAVAHRLAHPDRTEISAVAHRLAHPDRTEDVSLAHVTFAGGAVANIVNSGVSPREESHLRLDFERASVELTHGHGGYGDEDWRITPAPGHESAVLAAWKAGEHGRRSGHAAQFADALARLRAGERPPVSVADTRVTLRLVAGVYASAFTGHPVVPADLEPGSAFYERMDGFGPPWA